MADVNAAIDFTLRLEDSKLAGIITNSTGDRGGLTRFGIAAKYHADLLRTDFYTTMMRDDALAVAHKIYSSEYADFLGISSIRSQAVANALLSFAILGGAARAAQTMQQSLNQLGAKLTVDSSIGPKTLQALNSTNAVDLLGVFVERNRAYLLAIIANDPTQGRWKNGWMNRCDLVLTQSRRALNVA